jgi:hypothetical protein
MPIDNSNGRKWARFTLALALLLSVAGNVTHTVLAASTITLWLRVPPAVAWPVLTFLGIEVLVRIIWDRSVTHRLARNMVLLPAIPAAIVSYEHLYSLLLLMGERGFIALIGPAAIDGAMIGMTIVLLTTRPALVAIPSIDFAAEREPMRKAQEAAAEIEVERRLNEWLEKPLNIAPVSPAPIAEPKERAERKPRAGWDAGELARLLLDGTKDSEIVSKLGIGASTLNRYRRAEKAISADRNAHIPAEWKVRSDVAQALRMELTR